MNVVNSGSRFLVYANDVKTYKNLPTGTYNVNFDKMAGFYLTSRNDLTCVEEKIYGNHSRRVKKVFTSYDASERNLGVILSGNKGIGKSVFAKLLAIESIKKEMPVIVIDTYYPGIAGFLSSIEQEVVVLFDEFEKTFAKVEDCDPQVEMLTLFDGFDGGKKLFVITCNNTNQLNEFLINRPGRFHYHFTLGLPSEEEIREYMTDKLKPEYYGAIEGIINLSHMTDVSYDYLRAIAFELNQGYDLEETMEELNITRTRDVMFDLTLVTPRGIYYAYAVNIDFSERGRSGHWLYGDKMKRVYCAYNPSDITTVDGQLVIEEKHLGLERDNDDEDSWDDSDEEYKRKNKEFHESMKGTYLLFNKTVSLSKRFTV